MSDDRDGVTAPAAVNRDAITIRPVTDADYQFLESLYHSAREDELRLFPFDDEQKKTFIAQQFAAQTEHYRIHYPTARFCVIELNGEPIGRLYVDEWASQIRLVDIALVPAPRLYADRHQRDLLPDGVVSAGLREDGFVEIALRILADRHEEDSLRLGAERLVVDRVNPLRQ